MSTNDEKLTGSIMMLFANAQKFAAHPEDIQTQNELCRAALVYARAAMPPRREPTHPTYKVGRDYLLSDMRRMQVYHEPATGKYWRWLDDGQKGGVWIEDVDQFGQQMLAKDGEVTK